MVYYRKCKRTKASHTQATFYLLFVLTFRILSLYTGFRTVLHIHLLKSTNNNKSSRIKKKKRKKKEKQQ